MQNLYSNQSGRIGIKWLWWVLALALIAAIAIFIFIRHDEAMRQYAPGTTGGIMRYPGAATDDATVSNNYEFDDGLGVPVRSEQFQPDEFGEGIVQADIFSSDLNGDGANDIITRSRYENGTAHWYFEYKIEIATADGFIGTRPETFRTVEGAECSLQKYRFYFIPKFGMEKISREWENSWGTPSAATRTRYELKGTELKTVEVKQLGTVCNVSDLF